MRDNWFGDPKLIEWAWKRLSRASAGSITIWLCAGPFILAPFRWIVFGDPLFSVVFMAIGQCIGLALAPALIAAVLALPGLIFRGRYQVRPLFIATFIALAGAMFADSLFTPLAFFPLVGWFFMGLSLAVGLVSASVFTVTLLLTTFSHRWSVLIVRASLCLGTAAAIGQYRKVFVPGREAYMAKVFAEDGPSLARLLAPKANPPERLPGDFEAIGQQFRRAPASN